MPRLVGKPSKAPSYIGVALLVTILGAVALEYTGTIDLVPDFGQSRVTGRSALPNEK